MSTIHNEFQFGDRVEVRDIETQEWIKALFLKREKDFDGRIGYTCISPTNIPHLYSKYVWNQCRKAEWTGDI